MLTSRWNVPWITREIKTLIRKKQRIYNKAKRTNNEKHWQDESHHNYISQLLVVDEDGERKTPVVGKKSFCNA
jgi:hypothetical protein